jgi:hypothetical protein
MVGGMNLPITRPVDMSSSSQDAMAVRMPKRRAADEADMAYLV